MTIDPWTARNDAVWTFETDRFFVGLFAEEEDLDPADSFSEQEDIDAVRSGRAEWFCAAVRVYLKTPDDDWLELAEEYLGGCAYESVRDFYSGHRGVEARTYRASLPPGSVVCNYFPSMVRETCSRAREKLLSMGDLSSAMRR